MHKERNDNLISFTHFIEFQGEELGFGGPMNTFQKKGERLQNIMWFKGQQVVTMSHLWSCSFVWLALWLSSMELCLQRSGQELFLISKTSSFIASAWFFFSKSNQTLLCNTGQLFPFFYCSAPFSLFPLRLGQPNFPSPKMILVSSSYPTSKSGSKRRQFKGQIVPNSIYV